MQALLPSVITVRGRQIDAKKMVQSGYNECGRTFHDTRLGPGRPKYSTATSADCFGAIVSSPFGSSSRMKKTRSFLALIPGQIDPKPGNWQRVLSLGKETFVGLASIERLSLKLWTVFRHHG